MPVLFVLFFFYVAGAFAQGPVCVTAEQAVDAATTDPFATQAVGPVTAPVSLPWSDLPSQFQVTGIPLKESPNARVVRAKHTQLGRATEVAVRQARDSGAWNPHGPLARLGAEATLLQKIERGSHPGKQRVVRLMEFGHDYLATEWVSGQTLFDLLAGGKLTTTEAEKILAQVREAVAAIHAAGYVHADLNPKNIVISNLGEVKVIDLGISVREGTPHISRGAPGTASENQKALGRARFEDDFASLAILERMIRRQVDDASFSLEPFRALGQHLGIQETDPRKFYRSVAFALRDDHHVLPAELRPAALALAEKLGPWFSHELQISPELLERSIDVPLPPRYDLHVADRDRIGRPEDSRRGVVQWTNPEGKILRSEVIVRDPVSVETAMSRLPASHVDTFRRLSDLPNGSRVTSVLTKISSSKQEPLAKAEIHLVEDAAGNQTIIVDKVFTDIAYGPSAVSGSFLVRQALAALPNYRPEKVRGLRAWEVVNAETVLEMQERRRLGQGAGDAERFRGTRMDGFLRSLATKLGLRLEGEAALRNGKEEPLRNLDPEIRTGDAGAFGFTMPDLGSPVHYDNLTDGAARRRRNASLLNEYERRTGQTNVRATPAVARFDVHYKVGGN